MATKRTASDILAENRRRLSMDAGMYQDNEEEEDETGEYLPPEAQTWQQHDITAMQEAYRTQWTDHQQELQPPTMQEPQTQEYQDHQALLPPAMQPQPMQQQPMQMQQPMQQPMQPPQSYYPCPDTSMYPVSVSDPVSVDTCDDVSSQDTQYIPQDQYNPNTMLANGVKRMTVGGQTSDCTVTIRPADECYQDAAFMYQTPWKFNYGDPMYEGISGDCGNQNYANYTDGSCVNMIGEPDNNCWQNPPKPYDQPFTQCPDLPHDTRTGQIFAHVDTKTSQITYVKSGGTDQIKAQQKIARATARAERKPVEREPREGRSNRCYDQTDEIYQYTDSVYDEAVLDMNNNIAESNYLDVHEMTNELEDESRGQDTSNRDTDQTQSDMINNNDDCEDNTEEAVATPKTYKSAIKHSKLFHRRRFGLKRGRPAGRGKATTVIHHFPGSGSKSVTLTTGNGRRINKSLTAIDAPQLLLPNVYKEVDVRKAAVSAYIDQLVLENELVTQMSDTFTPPTSLCLLHEDYVRISYSIPAQFPTPKFRQWMSACLPQIQINTVCSDKPNTDIDSKRPCTRFNNIDDFINDTFYGCRRQLAQQCVQHQLVGAVLAPPVVSDESNPVIISIPQNPHMHPMQPSYDD